jgi:hypothetical protein
VPSNDGFGSDDDESLFPVSPEPGKDNPEESIRSSELRPSMMSAKEDELLSQREIPERQLRPFLERRWDQRQ